MSAPAAAPASALDGAFREALQAGAAAPESERAPAAAVEARGATPRDDDPAIEDDGPVPGENDGDGDAQPETALAAPGAPAAPQAPNGQLPLTLLAGLAPAQAQTAAEPAEQALPSQSPAPVSTADAAAAAPGPGAAQPGAAPDADAPEQVAAAAAQPAPAASATPPAVAQPAPAQQGTDTPDPASDAAASAAPQPAAAPEAPTGSPTEAAAPAQPPAADAEAPHAQPAPSSFADAVRDAAPESPRNDAAAARPAESATANPQIQPAHHHAPRGPDQAPIELRPVAAEPAAQQLAVQVSRAVKDGVDEFSIELKPETLGRVTVRLEFVSDAKVQAVIAAERPETLDLLKRDAREITRVLGEAGIQADAGSLNFSLHGNGGEAGRQTASGQRILFPVSDPMAEPAARAAAPSVRAGGIDIRV